MKRRRALGTGKLRKRGSIWIADYRDADGVRQRRALGPDRSVAQRRLAAIIRQRDLVVSGLAAEDRLDRSVPELIEEFLAELKARRSPRYHRRVKDILARVQASVRFRTVRDVNAQELMRYRRMRLGQGVANRTANMETRVFGTLLNWAVIAGLIPLNPVAKMQSLPTGRAYEKRPRRAMSEDEVERFVAATVQIDEERRAHAMAEKSGGRPGKERLPPIPQAPLWIALLETGARFGELTSTTWADLSESRATLTLRAPTTKSRKERVLPLRRELLDLLRALRVAQHDRLGRIPGPGDGIFVTVQGRPWNESRSYIAKRFREILDRAGVQRIDARAEKLDVHALRYTAATRMARNGVPLVVAQRLLGHSTVALTAQVYTQLDTEDLREAVERVPGLRIASE